MYAQEYCAEDIFTYGPKLRCIIWHHISLISSVLTSPFSRALNMAFSNR